MYARIPRVKIEYQLARPLFVRVVSQYTSMNRQPLVDPLTGQVLLVERHDRLHAFGGVGVQLAAHRLARLVPAGAGHRVLRRLWRRSRGNRPPRVPRAPPHRRRVLREGELRVSAARLLNAVLFSVCLFPFNPFVSVLLFGDA